MDHESAAEENLALLEEIHSGGYPIISLDRKKQPGPPSGWTTVWVDDVAYELNCLKIAVTVARRPGETGIALHPLLRALPGERAGQPATSSFVRLRRDGDV